MITNLSSLQKTFSDTINQAESDVWDPNNVLEYSYFINSASLIPFYNIIDEYRSYFITNYCEYIEVPEEYFYSPTGFSNYYYGTPDLDFLVLYFSGIHTLFEFNKKRIRVLTKSGLQDLQKLIIDKKNKTGIDNFKISL